MSQFKIENNVPRTTVRTRLKGMFPFKDMRPGDSFLVPIAEAGETLRMRQRIYQAAWRANLKITTKTQEGGIRVWLDGPRNDGEAK